MNISIVVIVNLQQILSLLKLLILLFLKYSALLGIECI